MKSKDIIQIFVKRHNPNDKQREVLNTPLYKLLEYESAKECVDTLVRNKRILNSQNSL